jgi:hypothetical protein
MLKSSERAMSAEETIVAYSIVLFPSSIGRTGQNKERKRKQARRVINRKAKERNKQITFMDSCKSAGKRAPFFTISEV